ncbi:metalloendopeptidase [Coemansia sp. RSA 1365]|nr:metalloendopeptidase [Coemansia sp. RSA 1365]
MVARIGTLVKAGVLNFQRKPKDISASVLRLIQHEKQVNDEVAAQKSPTFANTIAPLARLENKDGAESAIITFLQNVSTDKNVRDASSEAELKLRSFRMESLMREDVYSSVKAVLDNKHDLSVLDPEDRMLVKKMEVQYRRNGLGLSADKRKQLGEIKRRLIELGVEFSRNINEKDGVILFTRKELDGLPDSYFCDRETQMEEGVEKYVVTTKYPDIVPVMQMAKSGNTRRLLQAVEETRCPENIALLQEAIKLRLEAARLLGYQTHAEFVLEENMAKGPEHIMKFEDDLRKRLEPLATSEIKEIESLKIKDKEAAGEPYKGLFSWDYRYYSNMVKERKHNVSEEEVKQYFPVDKVMRGVLDICQDVLGLKFLKISNPSVWHSEVEMYEVWEANENEFVGHFYLDLYPRNGKYNHACVNPIRTGYEKEDGSREYPAAVMLANFPKPTSSTPALLTHDDVLTLLHEFGHIFHLLCTKTRWSYFGLDSVQMDFIEAPSQMLENWGWEPSVLQKFAIHHKTGEPIPEELVARLIASRNEGAGLFNLRQLFFGLFDMAIHNTRDANIDIPTLYRNLRQQITRFANDNQDACGAATFGHMMGGYDAGYYGYLFAKVFSADMYESRFVKDGINNPRTGLDYRNEILRPGGSRDAMISLKQFLGREPNSKAFLKSIGLTNISST